MKNSDYENDNQNESDELKLNFNDFLEEFNFAKHIPESYLKEEFDKYDLDKSGLLEENELRIMGVINDEKEKD